MKQRKEFIIIDLEMTCCNKGEFPKDEMEIIEIGAVKIREKDLLITGAFQQFVRPIRKPTLTEFAKELLHIRQKDIDEAKTFPDIWKKDFMPWLGDIVHAASWGGSDIKWLRRECEELPFTHHCNLFRIFGNGQKRVLKRNGLKWYGERHHALNDALTYTEMLLTEKPEIEWKVI